jgi:hypothetical protein
MINFRLRLSAAGYTTMSSDLRKSMSENLDADFHKNSKQRKTFMQIHWLNSAAETASLQGAYLIAFSTAANRCPRTYFENNRTYVHKGHAPNVPDHWSAWPCDFSIHVRRRSIIVNAFAIRHGTRMHLESRQRGSSVWKQLWYLSCKQIYSMIPRLCARNHRGYNWLWSFSRG